MKNLLQSTAPLVLIVCFSCTTEQSYDFHEISSESSNLKTKVCLDMPLENENDLSGKALSKSKLWDRGKVITIKFLGGTTFLQEKVFEVVEIWEEYANVDFQIVKDGDSDLRVSFEETGASWSYIGTDALNISQDNATMNFGWFTDTTLDNEIIRTTLHEFGHALGAIHEHSSPASDIQWNKESVYEYYAKFGWTEADVEHNLFNKYAQDEVTNSEYDPYSIMHYPISSDLTLDGFSVPWNYELSDLDKEFIGKTYPFNENLALYKEASQISIHNSLPGEASLAVDGNTSGKWSDGSITRTATEDLAWWEVRLGNEYEIGDIVIWNRTDICCAYKLSNFDVFIYNDAGELSFKTTIADMPNPNVTIHTGGAVGSKVRVKLKDNNQLSLAEVEVYEY